MKIAKSQLKALIKECLVELLAEGLGNSLNESVSTVSRSPVGPRNRDAEPLPGQAVRRVLDAPVPRRSALDERVDTRRVAPAAVALVPKELARDPVMAAIFADTAQTTLLEQARNVLPGDAATNAAARLDPATMFGEENVDRWNQAAFGSSRPAGLPPSFIQDLVRGS